MYNRIRIPLLVAFTIALALAACGGRTPTSPPQVVLPVVTEGVYAPTIDPANFVQGVDNPYFPLIPGTVMIYEGRTEKGNEHDEVAVLTETKVIMGVICVVVQDTVTVDGKLGEQTLDWYAQDRQGNVWYFGEDSREYAADGSVASTQGSWEAGVNGAQPGIIMEAHPVASDTYRQEYAKGGAEDMAQVLSLNETSTVATGTYTNLLTTYDWSALDPTVVEKKYYAPGIGFILTQAVQGGDWHLGLVVIQRP